MPNLTTRPQDVTAAERVRNLLGSINDYADRLDEIHDDDLGTILDLLQSVLGILFDALPGDDDADGEEEK